MDDPKAALPDPRGRCDHICLQDGEHVERGEPHFYGYEIPSPRTLADERNALRAENEDLRASREMWASARSESISLDLAALRARLEEAERRENEMLSHYSAALDEVYWLRRALAYEARVVEAHTLDISRLGKNRREQLERCIERLKQSALGNVLATYAGVPSRSLDEGGGPMTDSPTPAEEANEAWKRKSMGEWCPGPAIVDGHKLPCDLFRGHTDPCQASPRNIERHRQDGINGCAHNGCDLAHAPAEEANDG